MRTAAKPPRNSSIRERSRHRADTQCAAARARDTASGSRYWFHHAPPVIAVRVLAPQFSQDSPLRVVDRIVHSRGVGSPMFLRTSTATTAALAGALLTSALLAACGLTGSSDPSCSTYLCNGGEAPPVISPEAGVGNTPEARRSHAKELFLGLYPEFVRADVCGRCHAAGLFEGAPLFLEGTTPELAYTTITDRAKYPTIVLPDFANSVLLTKGQHAGQPLLEAYPELAEKIVVWLRWEAAALAAERPKTTEPAPVVEGLNSISLDALGGPGGITLDFEASFVSGFFRMNNTRVSVLGSSAVHIAAPKVFTVKADGTDLLDPSDSFGGVDVTCPMGVETKLAPSGAIFAGDGWAPWDPSNRVRLEVGAIEAAVVEVGDGGGVAQCLDVAKFQAEVMPVLTGGGVGSGVNGGTCRAANCHGGAQKSPDMAAALSPSELCQQIRRYLDFAAPDQSRILRPSINGHAGGVVQNPQAYRDFWTTRIAAGQIF